MRSKTSSPVATGRLAEQTHGGIPGIVAALEQPAPIGRQRQGHPGGRRQRAGQMDYGGVGGDHEIEILDQCGRVDHRRFQVEALRQIFDRKAGFRQLLQPVPLLQAHQAHSGNFCQGREVGQRNGAGPIAAVLRIALPMDADPERRAVAAEAIAPGADEGLVGGQIGDVGGNRIEVGLEDARQREQRRLHVDGRRRLSFVEEGHARQIEVRARLEDRNPARRAGDDDFCAALLHQGSVADELQRIAQALLVQKQDCASFERRAVPDGFVPQPLAPVPFASAIRTRAILRRICQTTTASWPDCGAWSRARVRCAALRRTWPARRRRRLDHPTACRGCRALRRSRA